MSAYDSWLAWHKSKVGLLIFGLAELALAYVFASWAIDTGSLLDWFLAIVLLVGGLQNIVRLIWKVLPHGRKV
jgi:hypothetical protein